MNISTTIVPLNSDILCEVVIFDVHTRSTHVAIIFEVNGAIDCVDDVHGIACEVSHILTECVTFEVNVWLRVGYIRCLVRIEIRCENVRCSTKRADILLERVILEQDRTLVQCNNKRAHRFINRCELEIVKFTIRVSHVLGQVASPESYQVAYLEVQLP